MNRHLFSLFLLMFLFSVSEGKASSRSMDLAINTESDLDDLLSESSGLVYRRGKIWTHNDSGSEAEIYTVNPLTGEIEQTIRLENIINHDWEDIASDEQYIYIADTGNNNGGGRTDLAVYKISLDDIPLSGHAVIPENKIEIIRFYYPEQGISPIPSGNNNTAFDCEAMIVLNDEIHLFTKDWTSVSAGYACSDYVIPNVPHPKDEKYPARLINRYENLGFLVTGADSRESGDVILVGYQIEAIGVIVVCLCSDFKDNDVFAGKNDFAIIGSALNLGQVEGICFGETSSKGYISNESFKFNDFTYPAKIKSFELIFEQNP
ncbi:MAG: hypothetical protein LBH12_06865 [Dysgonamonadaceae bacterium]|nr:hypothetical protein [Dysgonamonadaceae bacterium]